MFKPSRIKMPTTAKRSSKSTTWAQLPKIFRFAPLQDPRTWYENPKPNFHGIQLYSGGTSTQLKDHLDFGNPSSLITTTIYFQMKFLLSLEVYKITYSPQARLTTPRSSNNVMFYFDSLVKTAAIVLSKTPANEPP